MEKEFKKMKLTKKQIEIIRHNTPAEIVGKQRATAFNCHTVWRDYGGVIC